MTEGLDWLKKITPRTKSWGYSVGAHGFEPRTPPTVVGVLYFLVLISVSIFFLLFHDFNSNSLFVANSLISYNSKYMISQSPTLPVYTLYIKNNPKI